VVIGDFGTGSATERSVATGVRLWAQADPFDALVTTGDNVYPDGAPARYDAAWHEPYGWVDDEGTDIVASLGNHDSQHGHQEDVMELLGMPSPYYARVIGDAQLFVLNGNEPEDPEQLEWLRRELARSETAWQIVVFHQPAYSCGRYEPPVEIVAEWRPFFERHDVELVLNGHDHNYQRFAPQGGVVYVVTGGGGAGLYAVRECPGLLVHDDDKHHFLAIEGSSEELKGKVIALDGAVLDEFTMRP
jgi:3',5'-cyclic AMP phosphodiesterase CpdA